VKKTLFLLIIIVALILTVVAQEKRLSPAFSAMVSTERAFAKMAGIHGVRNSFITFFADDGINFTPNPVKTRENLMSTPPPATLPPVILNWTPIYGDIAAAEDLGYNTGPFVVEDKSPEKRPTRHGMFFSVWRRQADKSWKVVLDMGASTPSAVAPLDAPFVAAAASRVKPRDLSPGDGHEEILRIDRDFFLGSLNKPLGEALKDSLQETARVYVTGKMPFVGRRAILAGDIADNRMVTGEPLDGAMARSGDFGYVYGRYELKSANASEKGYYSRVWRLDRGGKWHIAMFVLNPLPAT
jgi:ketosteroid isomerase-like protein